MLFNAQSTAKVLSGRREEGREKKHRRKKEQRQKLVRLEALAVGKACYARLYSNARFRTREPLIALGHHQEGFF